MIHRVTLQQADRNGLLVQVVIHTSAFTQHVHGTHARATQAEHVRIENRLGRAKQIAASIFLMKRGNIEYGWDKPPHTAHRSRTAAVRLAEPRLAAKAADAAQ